MLRATNEGRLRDAGRSTLALRHPDAITARYELLVVACRFVVPSSDDLRDRRRERNPMRGRLQ